MTKPVEIKTKQHSHALRSIATFGLVFFLLTAVFTSLVIIPSTNRFLDSEHSKHIDVDLAFEAELFKNYIANQQAVLRELAQISYPVDAPDGNPTLVGLSAGASIGGDDKRLVLQDISGKILIQTNHSFQGSYTEGSKWVNQIADGSLPYYFKLLSQSGDYFTYQLAVPALYENEIEGVLSAEVTAPLAKVFLVQKFDRVAFKLTQGSTTINTESAHIKIAREDSIQLESPDLTFTLITDNAIVKARERKLRNIILLVLLAGFGLSFLLFALIEYRRLINDNPSRVKFSFGRNYIIPVTIVLMGMVTSVIAFWIIFNGQKVATEKDLLSRSTAHIETIHHKIEDSLQILDSIKLLFDTAGFMQEHQFASFFTHSIESNPNFHSITWVPNIPLIVREEFEQKASTTGQPDYSIRELNSEGIMVKADIRENYFPVHYAEPMKGRETIIGFDLASNSKLLSALSKAGRSGTMVAITPEILITENPQEALLVFKPIYHENIYHNLKATNSLDNIKGFVLLAIHADDLIGDALINDPHVQSIHIQDLSTPNSPIDIYGEAIATQKYSYNDSINIASTTWRVNLNMTVTDVTMRWVPWAVLLAGTIFTLLIAGWLVHLINQREIVEAQVKARTSEIRKLSLIVAKSNDAFMITQSDDSRPDSNHRKIVYINDAFTRLSGYSEDEAVGKPPAALLHGAKTDQKQLEELYNSVQREESFRGEFIHYSKDKKAYWVDINAFPLKDNDGEISQFACVMRDISDKKQAESEREKLIGKLTDSNEELERFAFVCSHDLQEPLRMIRSFSEKLETRIGADLANDEKSIKYLGFITDGAERAQNLISDILTYSSLGKDHQKLQRVNSDELVLSIKVMMRAALEESGAKITHDDLPEVQGHKTQLYQLFQNLINNAIKYQTAGAAPHVHLSAIDAGEFWQFSVKDKGIGIEARHLHKIFDVFQRLHRRDQYSGTGVGLSICKKVIERHGGTLWVDSEVGVGSTFHFTLLKPILTEVKDERRKAG